MSQLVDPFVPVVPATKVPLGHLGRTTKSPAAAILRPQRQTAAQPTHQPSPRPGSLAAHHQPTPQSYRYRSTIPPKQHWLAQHPHLRRTLHLLQYPAVVIGSLAAGILAQSIVVGQLVLLVYAIVALVFRIDSRTTFYMAFFLLCGLVALLIFRSNNAMAANFAAYAFILLLVGVLSLLRELKERYV